MKIVMKKIIIQASSRGWTGEQDLCVREVHGQPVIHWTVKNVSEAFPQTPIVIAAPQFDQGGELESLRNSFAAADLSIFYGHDASPLQRLLAVCDDMAEDDYVLRVVGLHFCVDLQIAAKMALDAEQRKSDCVSLPDDFNPKFNSDVFRVGALRKLQQKLEAHPQAAQFMVQPKFFMFKEQADFNCRHYTPVPEYEDQFLLDCRNFIKELQAVERHEVTGDKIWAGDQISFHYEMAAQFLSPEMKLLDVACGAGAGMPILATAVREVHGADLDPEAIAKAQATLPDGNFHFHTEDVTRMSFPADSFDAITSFETLEHVDSQTYLLEIKRVLKPGGIFILSTPQNSIGRIPTDPYHLHEYSLSELKALVAPYFDIVEVIGIKAGRITIPGDPIGANTMLVLKNSDRQETP
jgi:2-polyprenyl-3-methyl-5-hydroxy-6-metoxy-1,4-benzoquinol methylase